jgi:hypothetical protein
MVEKTVDLHLLLLQIFKGAWAAASDDFSGLGVVLYQGEHALPYIALRPDDPPRLIEALGVVRVAEVLSQLASIRSPWHDGFHFIDAAEVRLTHVAQFVSPPIPRILCGSSAIGGARHMSAALASRVEGIAMVGVLTGRGDVSVYLNGEMVLHEEIVS